MLSQLDASQSGGSRGKSGKMPLKLCQLTCAGEDWASDGDRMGAQMMVMEMGRAGSSGRKDSAKKVATFDGPAASIVGTQVAIVVVACFSCFPIEVDLLALYFRFSIFLPSIFPSFTHLC